MRLFFCCFLIGLYSISISQIQISNTPDKSILTTNNSSQFQKCSPRTALLLSSIQENPPNSNYDQFFSAFEKNNKDYVSAFIVVESNFDIKSIEGIELEVNAKVDNVITVKIPIGNIERLASLDAIKYIDLSFKSQVLLDEAKQYSNVNLVHNGNNLSQSYSGNGVIVGIIDNGFDYTHPTFYNLDYTEYRISRVWDQLENGNSPSGYTYGNELIGYSDIMEAQYSSTSDSHGTHVAGIAAGSGSALSDYFKGIAFDSEIILVSTTLLSPDIADGISYIFSYSDQVNKPCVINMSLGSQYGPHDGTSLFDQFVDSSVGEGKIVVGAAGNDGSTNLHLNSDFGNNETIYSFIEFPGSSNNTNGASIIDIWGEEDEDLLIAVSIYNIENNEFEDYTDYISTSEDGTYQFTLEDSDFVFSDTCFVAIGVEHANPFNNKPHITIYFDNSDQDELIDIYDYVMLEVVGTNTYFDAWCTEGIFSDLGADYPVIDGNSNSTVAEMGGVGNSVITVGAYTTKNNYVDFQGTSQNIPFYSQLGEIAPFSSLGPTFDNRTKPDVVAPGNVIVSSVNSFDPNFTANSAEVVGNVNNGQDYWWFATMQGTSMACPVITGIVALYLEANPNLTPEEIKEYMQDYSSMDNFTGSVPNNTWGYGKIDAHSSIKAIEDAAGIFDSRISNSLIVQPNPTTGETTIKDLRPGKYQIEVFDLAGTLQYSTIDDVSEYCRINLSFLKQGIYIVKLRNQDVSYQAKVIIHK